MSFFDLLRPKWRHHDPRIRLVATKKLEDMEQLTNIAKHDPSEKVAMEAVSMINDGSLLETIVMDSLYDNVALCALKKITHEASIFLIVINAKKLAIRNVAIERIHNQQFLAEILKSCRCLSTCISATKRISDISILEELNISGSHHPQIRMAIQDRIEKLSKNNPPEVQSA